MSRPEVLVTGMGVASPIGCGIDRFAEAQLAGRVGIGPITAFDPEPHRVRIAGQVTLPPELEMDRREAKRSDRCTQLARAAASLAVADAGLDPDAPGDPYRTGVVIGSGMGGAQTWEENYFRFFRDGQAGLRTRAVPTAMINDPAASIAIRYGLQGPCQAVATACASGADALVAGYQMIASGEVDVVVAGGAEAPVVSGVLAGFDKLGALSRRNEAATTSRPFTKDRDGFVLAEGAAVLVLESAAHAARRGACGHAVLRGYGRTADAHHVTMPHPAAVCAGKAVELAVRHAGAVAPDVGMVNAHGTSTPLNDAAEGRALHLGLGTSVRDVAVTATKSLTGHSLGASGAVEAVATVLALTGGQVPPTANVDDVDPDIELDVVHGAARPHSTGLALSNSFAFGGHNVVLAFAPGDRR